MQDVVVRGKDGRIIGKIERHSNGSKTVRDFYGKILGTYDPCSNQTRDFYGNIVAYGDEVGLLLSFANK